MAYERVVVSKDIVDRLLILEKCLGINNYPNDARLVADAAKEITKLRKAAKRKSK